MTFRLINQTSSCKLCKAIFINLTSPLELKKNWTSQTLPNRVGPRPNGSKEPAKLQWGTAPKKKWVLIHALILQLAECLVFWKEFQTQDDGSNGFWGLVGSCNFVVARYLLPKSVSQTSKQKTSNKIHRHSYHTYTVTFTHTFYYSIYIYSIKKKNLMSPTTKSRYPQGNQKKHPFHVDVSKNSGTPESSILIRFSIINHPFWGTPHTPIFGKTHESFHDPIPPSALAPRDVGPLPSYVLPRSAGAAAPAKTWVQRWEVLSDNKFLEAKFWKFQWF